MQMISGLKGGSLINPPVAESDSIAEASAASVLEEEEVSGDPFNISADAPDACLLAPVPPPPAEVHPADAFLGIDVSAIEQHVATVHEHLARVEGRTGAKVDERAMLSLSQLLLEEIPIVFEKVEEILEVQHFVVRNLSAVIVKACRNVRRKNHYWRKGETGQSMEEGTEEQPLEGGLVSNLPARSNLSIQDANTTCEKLTGAAVSCSMHDQTAECVNSKPPKKSNKIPLELQRPSIDRMMMLEFRERVILLHGTAPQPRSLHARHVPIKSTPGKSEKPKSKAAKKKASASIGGHAPSDPDDSHALEFDNDAYSELVEE